MCARATGCCPRRRTRRARPSAELITTATKGKAYAAIYPEGRDAAALHTSWWSSASTSRSHRSPATDPASRDRLYTAGYAQEALGFYGESHYIWLTTGGRYMRSELYALATLLYGRFH